MRRAVLGVAVVLGVLAGGFTGLAVLPTGVPDLPARPDTTPTPSPTAPTVPAAPAPQPDERLLLVWTPGSLPDGFADAVDQVAGVTATSVVAGGTVDLVGSVDADGQPVDVLEPGWAIPLDALAIDPATYPLLLPKGAQKTLGGLEPGGALLGETSAGLRELGPGGRVDLGDDVELTVADVVADTLVGAAELVVHRDDADGLGIATDRFVLVSHRGDRAEVEAAIRSLLPSGVAARIRGPGETPYMRHGDAVLPQSLVKEIFGEFAYRPPPAGERTFTQDPEWVADHIVTADVPILGQVRCHRGIVDQLVGVLDELEQGGLAALIDPAQYAGCWAPRLISPGGGMSRHAWGITVDVNADFNPTGVGSGQDPRLVEIMARWGFTWGGFWLVPDPMHFEYLRPPEDAAAKSRTG